MIKVKELRLGNYVYAGNRIERVIEIYPDSISTDRYANIFDFLPVELTQEILEAAGCVKDIVDGWNLWINGNLFVIRKLVSAKGYTLSVGDYCLCDIEHLHTFQNAYRLLTGQELQIDLQKLNK